MLQAVTLFFASFIPYAFLNHKPVKYFMKSRLDDKIPLVPLFVWPYISLFPLLIMGFITSVRYDQTDFLLAIAIANLLSSVVWILFPNGCKRPDITGRDISRSLLQFIYSHDGDRNAFPSGHVYLSVIGSWFLMTVFPEYMILLMLWGACISVSILFTKQHYFVDLPAGLLVAVVSIFIVLLH